MHQAGKTDEAKSDLARLKKIREERAAAQLAREQADGAYYSSYPVPVSRPPVSDNSVAKASSSRD
jgi:hypothetical protein